MLNTKQLFFCMQWHHGSRQALTPTCLDGFELYSYMDTTQSGKSSRRSFVMAASADAVPSARVCPFVASAGDLTYFWGGWNDTEPEAVFIYHHDTETWTRRHTSGPHPPACLCSGGCAMSGHNLYLYGGFDKNRLNCGDFYELNTQTWQWRKVSDGNAGGPGKKFGCRMMSYQDQLLVFGGLHDEMPSPRQAEAIYEKDESYVRTNEVHGYSLTSGRCHCVGVY